MGPVVAAPDDTGGDIYPPIITLSITQSNGRHTVPLQYIGRGLSSDVRRMYAQTLGDLQNSNCISVPPVAVGGDLGIKGIWAGKLQLREQRRTDLQNVFPFEL